MESLPFSELRLMPAVFYTDRARVVGQLPSAQWRFSDAVNVFEQDFLQLRDVVRQPFYATSTDWMPASAMLLAREVILLGVPDEAQVAIERSPAQQALVAERVRVPAILEAWPFTVDGVLHLAPGTDLLQHMHDPQRDFLPVTDATVTYHPNPLLSFTARFLVINRRRVRAVIEAAAIGQHAAPDPDFVIEAQATTLQVSGTRAAEILSAAAGLGDDAFAPLQQDCDRLAEQGRIARRVLREGAVLFRQGDRGDTFYAVENGTLEASLVIPGRQEPVRVAEFTAGDFFGEMAIFGGDRRTVTVRAVSEASLLAVQEEGLRRLMRRFPRLAAGILDVMGRRQAVLLSLNARGSAPPGDDAGPDAADDHSNLSSRWAELVSRQDPGTPNRP